MRLPKTACSKRNPGRVKKKKELSFTGIGLHTGKEITAHLKPASVNTGLCFKRVDLEDAPEIKVSVQNVRADNMSGRCSIIGKGESAIQTIEHLNLHNVLCFGEVYHLGY